MKSNYNLTSVVERNRHDDGTKISIMANDIAATRRVTSEKLSMYQDKHDDMLYHTIIALMSAPEHNANDTFTVDGELYNFTASGYEAVLKKFDNIRRKLEEAQVASEKLPGMEEAYTKLISEVLGINTEDVVNVDATNMEEDNNMKGKYKYLVIHTNKECDANTTLEIQKALSSGNVHAFDIGINNNGLNSRIGVLTTGHNKALKIVLDYLGSGMPSFKEFHESGTVFDLGYGRRWCVGDISITSNEGVIGRWTETLIIDQDCEPTKLSASEPGHLTPLLDEEEHCCNNCNDKGNKEVCQGCFDCEEGVQPLEPSNNNCDNDEAEKSNVTQWLVSAKSEISHIDKTYYVKIRDIKHDTKRCVIICEKRIIDALEHSIKNAQIENCSIDNITNITLDTSYLGWVFELNHGEVFITIDELGMVAGDSIVISDMT